MRGGQADLLGSVALVLQRTAPDILPPDLALRIDAFIDPDSLWTLETAANAGHVKLLNRGTRMVWPRPRVPQEALRLWSGDGRPARQPGCAQVVGLVPPPLDAATIYKLAGMYGHVHVFQWLRDERLYAHAPYSATRIISNYPSGVRWLHGQQSVQILAAHAATLGDLDYIRWLHNQPQRTHHTDGAMD